MYWAGPTMVGPAQLSAGIERDTAELVPVVAMPHFLTGKRIKRTNASLLWVSYEILSPSRCAYWA